MSATPGECCLANDVQKLIQKGVIAHNDGYGLIATKWPFGLLVCFGYHLKKTPSFVVIFWGKIYCDTNSLFSCLNFLRADACNYLALNGFESCCFSLAVVRSHACEVDPYGMLGGCSHICLLSSNYKARTCRCRTGFILGSDGRSCKSMLSKSESLPAANIPGYRSGCYLKCLSVIVEITWDAFG